MADNFISVTPFASAARSADANSDDILNKGFRGLIVFFNVSVAAGDDTMTLTIQGKDAVSGEYYTLLTGGALSTTGLRVYEIHPEAAAASGGVTAVANRILPETWRAQLDYTQVGEVKTAITCSVSAVHVR